MMNRQQEIQQKAKQALKDISDGCPWFVDSKIDKLDSIYKSLEVSRRKTNQKVCLEKRPITQLKKRMFYTPPKEQSIQKTNSFVLACSSSARSREKQHRLFARTVSRSKSKSEVLSARQPVQQTYSKLRSIYQKDFFVNGMPFLQLNLIRPSTQTHIRKGKILTGRPQFRVNHRSVYL